MKAKFSSLMNGKLVLLVISVLALTSFAAASNISVPYSTTSYGPETYQGDTFSLSGLSGNILLSTVSTTTDAINFADLTIADSGNFTGSEQLTVTYNLTLDGVTHTLTQQATWTIGLTQDSFATVAGTPVLFVTPDGTWNVTLDAYSITGTSVGDFTVFTNADFTPVPAPVPEPTTLATLLGFGIFNLAAVFGVRRKLT